MYRCNKGRRGYPYCVLKRNKGMSWQAYCVSQRAYYAGSSNKENGSGGESALPVFCFSVVTSSRCHGCRVTDWICLCYVCDNSVTTKWRIKICCHAGKCLFIREFCVVVTTWQQKKEFFIGRECILVVVFLPSHFRCDAYSCVFLRSLKSAEI